MELNICFSHRSVIFSQFCSISAFRRVVSETFALCGCSTASVGS